MSLTEKNELKVNTKLLDFVNNEIIPGTDIKSDEFWTNFGKIVHELAPINKKLIQKREDIQKKIDEWHKNNKGKELNSRIERNFGMMRPEGYRKCIRLMKLADRFQIPVVSFIDTPGAYPGLGAEQRGQASAIANSIECCMSLTVPNISIIIGEGGSGGAIALASSNKVIMLENSIYSVISPEGCASILWRDPSKSLQAAEAMKLTAKDLLKLGVIDEIISEPLGGAHRDPEIIAADIKHSIIKNLKSFENLSKEEIYDHRKAKFLQIGRDKGFNETSNIDSGGLSYKNSDIQKFASHIVKNKLIYAGIGFFAATSLIVLIF